MGVRNCYRTGCNNILADWYMPEVGYICRSCIDEFKESVEGQVMNKPQIIKKLKKFMQTTKGYKTEPPIDIEEFFKS